MTTVRSFRQGRALFAMLWITGLGILGALVRGWIPGGLPAALVLAFGLCITIAVGVISQRCGFFARPVLRVSGVRGRLSLTFDDGPDPVFTPQVLDLLARFGQRATFFVIGEKVARHPALARRIVEQGHEVGNHTLRHRWHMALWPASRIARDLARSTALIEEHSGQRPTLFRPPAAILSPRIEAGARRAALLLVGFSMRSGDGSPAVSPRRALGRLLRGLAPGAILVLHDGAVAGRAPRSLAILAQLCEAMQQQGLSSVPLGELLEPQTDELSRGARLRE